MDPLQNMTDEHIAAAQLRIVLDKKLGRTTPEIVRRIAALPFGTSSGDEPKESTPQRLSVVEAKLASLDVVYVDENFTSGVYFQGQGELAEARDLWRKIADSRRTTLGPDHPDTLQALSNLAAVLQGQGELAEARDLWRKIADSRRTTLGPDHPDTLQALSNLAAVL
ncbi:tetratricopeptide repeat protein, partial [Saccharopolyspora sp. NPDC050642]|uniref:tetratricopeptide repeat protein n=1 Tax=Saccharopolyspora sp. NPDC050642 TaxID=3157099 RepID=UPI0033E50051